MTFFDKHIIEVYTGLFKGLSDSTKIELIENLSKSLKSTHKRKEKSFYNSFGAFASSQTAAGIAGEIRKSRKFRKKTIKF